MPADFNSLSLPLVNGPFLASPSSLVREWAPLSTLRPSHSSFPRRRESRGVAGYGTIGVPSASNKAPHFHSFVCRRQLG